MATTVTWPNAFYKEIPQNELPVTHRIATILSLVITFQVLNWLTVGFRMYCRCVLKHAYGWDDCFVVVSLCITTVTTALIGDGMKYGMGQHYAYVNLNPSLLIGWSKVYFFSTLFYFLANMTIKISILFQYLRLFRNAEARFPRCSCIAVMICVAIWGTTYFTVQLFSCHPISDGWSLNPDANCHLAMSFALNTWLGWYYTHAITNMLFDYLILLLPLFFRRHLEIDTRGRIALLGLFGLGVCVATISAIRLVLLVMYKGGLHPSQDATWYAPAILLTTLLEIQAAVICASVPIFWPVVAQVLRLGQIEVTREVTLHSEARSVAPGLRGWKRQSESSETELHGLTKNEKGSREANIKDPYITGWRVPEDHEDGYRATVNTSKHRHEEKH